MEGESQGTVRRAEKERGGRWAGECEKCRRKDKGSKEDGGGTGGAGLVRVGGVTDN